MQHGRFELFPRTPKRDAPLSVDYTAPVNRTIPRERTRVNSEKHRRLDAGESLDPEDGEDW